MKPRLFYGIILFLVAGASLFYLKYTVEVKETQLAEMKVQYLEDQKSLRVLKAEWTMLNSPAELQGLSEKYLTIGRVKNTQLASWAEGIPGTHMPLTPISYASKYTLPGVQEVAISSTIPIPGRGDEP